MTHPSTHAYLCRYLHLTYIPATMLSMLDSASSPRLQPASNMEEAKHQWPQRGIHRRGFLEGFSILHTYVPLPQED